MWMAIATASFSFTSCDDDDYWHDDYYWYDEPVGGIKKTPEN